MNITDVETALIFLLPKCYACRGIATQTSWNGGEFYWCDAHASNQKRGARELPHAAFARRVSEVKP